MTELLDITGNPLGVQSLGAGIALGLLIMLTSLAQFVAPIWLLARNRPEREPFATRAAATVCALFALNCVIWLVAVLLPSTSWQRYVGNFVLYSLLLVAFVPAVRTCYETSVYHALFCVTAGYSIQNLGSGLGELARIVAEACSGKALGLGAASVIANVACALVAVACYRPFIARAARIRTVGREARGMLGMLGLVICIVIAYDVVIRGLGNAGAAWGFLLALRVVHAAVCLFVLYAEYQMLVNARLAAEVATAEALAAERERQYELSRDTIAAVNRRVHDIRHAVLRELSSNDVQVDRAVLAEVARDIDVYGAMVRTGNDVLDTLLTEKALLAERQGVTLSYIADGTALAGMDASDVYGLVGGVLDVALAEAACGAGAGTTSEAGSVSFTLRAVGELASLHVEWRMGAGAANAVGSPSTSALSGTASARSGKLAQPRVIAESLGGSLVLSAGSASRSIDVLLPTG